MNDDKKLDRNPVSGIQPQPSSPVGTMRKEEAPIGNLSELTPAGPEVRHDIEGLEGLGVKENNDRPVLTEDRRQVGIDHAIPPPPTAPTGLVQIPLTKEEALAEVKGRKPTDSGWGLGTLILKVLKGIAGA